MKLMPVRRELQLWSRVENKACMRDNRADACEEGVTEAEAGED